MNYFRIDKDNLVNGDGFRTVLWVSGCSNACKGCHNPESWNPNNGKLFDDDAKKEVLDSLKPDHISGITFSGGDPFYPGNIKTVTELMREIRKEFGNSKTIWLWTGSLIEDLREKEEYKEALNYIDVLVDGPFILEQKKHGLKWKGSENQRVINLPETLKADHIILWTK